MAFDFNHLNNVLISRDYREARLIDIDGASRGSIQSDHLRARVAGEGEEHAHKPALDVDLCTLLPLVVQQLMFGKGRGKGFVDEQVSRVRRARCGEAARAIIREVLVQNFFPELAELASHGHGECDELAHQPPSFIHSEFRTKVEYDAWLASGAAAGLRAKAKHLGKAVEWFYATLMRRPPWDAWVNDIYDAMRCIDHLPVG